MLYQPASFNPLPRISGFLTRIWAPYHWVAATVSIPFRGLVVFSLDNKLLFGGGFIGFNPLPRISGFLTVPITSTERGMLLLVSIPFRGLVVFSRSGGVEGKICFKWVSIPFRGLVVFSLGYEIDKDYWTVGFNPLPRISGFLTVFENPPGILSLVRFNPLPRISGFLTDVPGSQVQQPGARFNPLPRISGFLTNSTWPGTRQVKIVSIPFRGLVVFSPFEDKAKVIGDIGFNPLPRVSGFLTYCNAGITVLRRKVSIPFRGLVVFSLTYKDENGHFISKFQSPSED